MTVIGFHDMAKMTSGTTGTGTLTLGSASSGYLSFASAGVVDTERVTYTIRDGAAFEVGRGTYTASGTTLSRDTVLSSSNSGNKIVCTGRETVFVSVAAEDLQPFASYYGNTTTVPDTTSGASISLDTEWVDQFDLASVATDSVTIAKRGWYFIEVNISLTAGGAMNGYVSANFEGFIVTQGFTTAMGVTQTGLYITCLFNAGDNEAFDPVKLTNQSGQSVDVYINDFTILKLGNHL